MVWLTVTLALVYWLARQLAGDTVTRCNARRANRLSGTVPGSFKDRIRVYRYFSHSDGMNWQD